MAITETISTASATAKSLAEALSTTRSKLGSTSEAGQALMEVQSLVISLQSSLLEVQAKVLELQEENSELRAKIRDPEAGTAQQVQYERRKSVSPGSWFATETNPTPTIAQPASTTATPF